MERRGWSQVAMEVTLAAAAVTLFLGLISFWRKTKTNTSKVRKARYAPVAGTVLNQILNFHRLHDYTTDNFRKHPCFRMLHPGRSFIGVSDPRDVEYILSTNFANYGKGWYNHDNLGGLLGDGIFAVDGEKWRHQRKLASHEFSTRNLREYSSSAFRRDATRLAEVVSEAASSNQTVDLRDLLMKTTMDSIFKVGFGVDLDTLRGSSEEGVRFSQAFDDASEIVCGRYSDVLWRMKKALNIGSEATLRKNVRFIDDFTYRIIEEKMERMAEANSANDLCSSEEKMKKENILSRFLLERENEPDKISKTYLKDIILNFLIAGKDTTASVLSWFFYMMCKNKEIQRRVAEEVDSVSGPSSGGSPVAEFTEKLCRDVEYLPFLHAALNETLRLYPGVPQDPKMCFSDDTLPSGFDVRAGDIVVYMPYSMGRLKELWGEDAEVFRPERWLEEDGSLRHESPFKFTAFQAGPRVCLGREFAYRQMKTIVATLLHFFTFQMAEEGKNVGYRTMLTLQIQELQVRAFPRQPVR
ncbi:cytochrome P450 704C1-like [Wolffia australiana]